MHIMLDLETWGKTPGSDIRSIGAVVFDPIKGVGGDQMAEGPSPDYPEMKFYIATENPLLVDPTGETDFVYKYPLEPDPETVVWWQDQPEAAQAAFENPVDLKIACETFKSWIVNQLPPSPTYDDLKAVRIWANDPHFDVSILDAVYRAVGVDAPWHYRSPRSMKTICEAAGMTSADYSNYGTAHNALDDAIAQAMTVCEAYKRLGLQK